VVVFGFGFEDGGGVFVEVELAAATAEIVGDAFVF
jgi:hypothetical protein